MKKNLTDKRFMTKAFDLYLKAGISFTNDVLFRRRLKYSSNCYTLIH